MQYIMLTLAALLLAVNFSLTKVYQSIEGTAPKAGVGFTSLLGLFTAVVFYALNGFEINITVYSFIMAALSNLLVVGYTLLGFRLLKHGSMALYTLFLMSGGMTVPYIWGLIFLDESISIARMGGLVLILASVFLSNFADEKINYKQILMCVAVFFINGFVSVVSKLHQIEAFFSRVNTMEFVILGGVFNFIFSGILFLIMKNDEGKKKISKIRYKSLLVILSSAIVSGFSYMLQLTGAESLPATVLYPFVTGGTIVFSTIVGKLLFKEKLSKKLVLSVVLCFLGTIMFL